MFIISFLLSKIYFSIIAIAQVISLSSYLIFKESNVNPIFRKRDNLFNALLDLKVVSVTGCT